MAEVDTILVRRNLNGLPLEELFHILWTKAVSGADYNKAEWQELERRFHLLGRI